MLFSVQSFEKMKEIFLLTPNHLLIFNKKEENGSVHCLVPFNNN